jgi:hypothetical protein
VRDKQPRANLAKREEEHNTGVDNTRVAAILACILSTSADREGGGIRERFGETETQATTASQPEAP